jgi:hypothetical protein
MGKFIDLTGRVFGRLKILEKCGHNKWRQAIWKCQCKIVKVSYGNLISGKTMSCGCYFLEVNHYKRKVKHINDYGNYVGIILSHKKDLYECFIDKIDLQKIQSYCITVNVHKRRGYNTPYVELTRSDNYRIFKFQLGAFLLNVQKESNLYCDHIDRNPLNNRMKNLRLASYSQNGMNRRKCSDKNKYKGYSWHIYHKKYCAAIRLNHKPIYLGDYTNEIDAAEAYDKAALKYFKEFAYLNFPEKRDQYIKELEIETNSVQEELFSQLQPV